MWKMGLLSRQRPAGLETRRPLSKLELQLPTLTKQEALSFNSWMKQEIKFCRHDPEGRQPEAITPCHIAALFLVKMESVVMQRADKKTAPHGASSTYEAV